MVSVSKLFNTPSPLREVTRVILRNYSIGSYRFRYEIGALHRPQYAYLIYQVARLAKRLGEPRVSVLEFGVAGGDGLLRMEYHAEKIEKMFGVAIELYGFDTGAGLPAPVDYRDLPYHWKPGFFKMDLPLLKSKLKRSKLVIGNVRDSVETFASEFDPAPIGAIAFDLDFYSSTVSAFKILDLTAKYLLPRVPVYFDDVVFGDTELYNDYSGVRLAIGEFNRSHEQRKLSSLYHLRAKVPVVHWHYYMWSFHAFDHPQYCQFVGEENQQIPI